MGNETLIIHELQTIRQAMVIISILYGSCIIIILALITNAMSHKK